MYNSISIIGNVGGEVDFRYIPSGAPVANFSVAVNYRRPANSETGAKELDETQWFRIVCWRGLAEYVQNYVTKGVLVFVEGRLKASTYQANDGTERHSLEIIARTVRPMSSRGDSQSPSSSAPPPSDGMDNVEDIPF